MVARLVRLFLTMAGALACFAPATHAADVKPTVDCITPSASGNFWVYFGYANTGSQTFIEFGDANVVVPGLGFQGQPEVFNAGVYPRVFRAIFNSEAFPGISWELDGKSAVATLSSPRCVAASTGAVSAITTTGATLHGNVEPDAIPVTYRFEYGKVGGASSLTPDRQATPATDLPVSEPLTGLEPGTTYRYKLVASGSLTTVGEALTFTTLPGPAPVPPSADVSISQAVTPALLNPNDLATATATLTNAGPDAAEGVELTIRLPASAVIDAPALPAGCTSGTDGVTVTCTVGALASGATTTRGIAFRLAPFGAARAIGQVTATTADPMPTNNVTVSDFTIPVPTGQFRPADAAPAPTTPPASATAADLALTRTGPVRAVRLGRTATLVYAVRNQGTAAAAGTRLTIRLPSGLTKRSLTGASCTGRRVLRCSLGTLAPGASRTITLRVRIGRRGVLNDSATVTSAGSESAVANNVVDGVVRGRR